MRAMFEDRWVPVGLEEQVLTEAVHPVVLGGYGLALWRSLDGAIQLWEDRCPHRGMRLSFGFVRGDRLSCLYHGWEYGKTGQCGHIPAHPDLVPPKTICVPSYAVRSHRGILFANLADAPKADWPEAPDGTWRAVRSIVTTAPIDTVRSYLGHADNALGHTGRAASLGLVEIDVTGLGLMSCGLQIIEAGRTAIHISSATADPSLRQRIAQRAVRMRRELERR